MILNYRTTSHLFGKINIFSAQTTLILPFTHTIGIKQKRNGMNTTTAKNANNLFIIQAVKRETSLIRHINIESFD